MKMISTYFVPANKEQIIKSMKMKIYIPKLEIKPYTG